MPINVFIVLLLCNGAMIAWGAYYTYKFGQYIVNGHRDSVSWITTLMAGGITVCIATFPFWVYDYKLALIQ